VVSGRQLGAPGEERGLVFFENLASAFSPENDSCASLRFVFGTLQEVVVNGPGPIADCGQIAWLSLGF
jgi:hypothetical protein